MNAKEMLFAIDSTIAANAEAERNMRNALAAKAEAGIEAVSALLPALREIAPVAYRLTRIGVGNYEYGVWNKFRTDGVSHRWGFAQRGSGFTHFGAEAGGACGQHGVFVDVGTGKWAWYAGTFSGEYRIHGEMDAGEFAEFAAAPYVCFGRLIEDRKHFILDNLPNMATAIGKYIARVEDAVREFSGNR